MDDITPLHSNVSMDTSTTMRVDQEQYHTKRVSNTASPTQLPDLMDLSHSSNYDSPKAVMEITTEKDFTTKKHEKFLAEKDSTRFIGYALRTVLLDIPILIILLSYVSTVWVHHVHNKYLYPQLKSLYFSTERSEKENTYYTRVCDVSDMTTKNGADLFLHADATPEEAYQHQLKHGFTVFKHVLKHETAQNLRNFVVSRNRNLTEDEAIYVIENDNRYSFGLGTEEPSVAAAMKELATSKTLRPALEKVLGPDPALIEMTAITSSYGAVKQWWHDDVISSGSAVQFSRTFGPSYSVFVQLQNTTKEMGATDACPGTHYCSEGTMEMFCEEEGFQLVGDDGYWEQGDALLMNMNSWHRGAAHTDPNALDRVMLILTFVPKPITRAESRQLSQGITFSLRWDMWGHTLNDLANADTVMKQPWATLRALGLYKLPGTSWGIDYVSSASIRTANEDNGFRQDELDEFINRGGFKYLPDWLEFRDIDWDRGDSWPVYIFGTIRLCEDFTKKVSMYALSGYIGLFVFISLLPYKKNRIRCFGGAVMRAIGMVGIVAIIFYMARIHVDNSGWAADIRAKRRYASTVPIEKKYAKHITGPTTYPTKYDVLIETRFGSKQLAMYNDYVKIGHPGNSLFRNMITNAGSIYNSYTKDLQEEYAIIIAETIATNHGRFLYQGPDGIWIWLGYDETINYIKRELTICSNTLWEYLMGIARYMESDYKYGIHRNTALSIKHAVPYIETLRKAILKEQTNNKASSLRKENDNTTKTSHKMKIKTFASIPTLKDKVNNEIPKQRSLLRKNHLIKEPYIGAWIAEGDQVEIYDSGAWYYGEVLYVNAQGDYDVVYPDDSDEVVDQYSIRPYSKPYEIGEELECYVYTYDEYWECEITQIFESDNTSYYAQYEGGGVLHMGLGDLRRPGSRERTKYNFIGGYH